MPTVQVQQLNIYYEEHGRGQEALILLHAGWGTPVNGFEHPIARWSDRFRLLIPHRPGYGRSSRVPPFGPAFIREAAPYMLAVLDHAGFSSAHVWGHSDGAVAGAWMAILAPDRVRSLVFEGGHQRAHTHGEKGLAVMKHVRQHPNSLPAEMQAALAAGHGEDYWPQLLWNWTEAWRVLIQEQRDLFDGRLVEIACPTLLIHGGRDPHTPLSEAARMAGLIPSARTLFIPTAGHSLHDDPRYQPQVEAAVLALWDDKAPVVD